ncbi:serine hydrolase [Bacteriovorax sp. Seq25_V]|nr:serine hydrolase [Bacteriovorax sp. Seq25_V]
MESYKVLTKEINVTGLNYLLLNAPKKYYFGFSWYDLPPSDPMIGIESSSDLLLEIIEEVKSQGFESEDIFLCGFSQGGCIAMETFYKYQDTLGGVVALSPRLYPKNIPIQFSETQKKTPFFMAHGRFDEVINFNETKSIIEDKLSTALEIEFHYYEMGHEIDPYEILDLRNWLNDHL